MRTLTTVNLREGSKRSCHDIALIWSLKSTKELSQERGLFMSKCETCKNAELLIGAYTGTCYLECKLQQAFAETATLEELKEAILHPEIVRCEYLNGSPSNGGVTFDD